jgi:hypothetical protein
LQRASPVCRAACGHRPTGPWECSEKQGSLVAAL